MTQLILNCGSIIPSNYLDQSAIERNNNSTNNNLISAIIKFRKLPNRNDETQSPKLVTDDCNNLVANNESYEIFGIEYVCHGCNKLFMSVAKYNEHVLISHENRKYLRPDGFNEGKKGKKKEKKIYKHPCPHCKRTCKTRSALKLHLASHSDDRPHQCPHCDRAFKTKSNLIVHLRLHSSYRPYKCPYCPFDSTRSDQLKSHARVHTDEKKKVHPRECPFCAKRFPDSCSCRLHKKIHRKGNRYYCTECSYSASNASLLRNHFKKSHIGELIKRSFFDKS